MAKIKLYVQVQACDRTEKIEVEREYTVENLLDSVAALGLPVPAVEESLVFTEGLDRPIEKGVTLSVAGVKDGSRIHIHTCREIAVTVHFKEKTGEKDFLPSATVAMVHAWASGKFLASAADATEHALQICNTEDRPTPDTQIGTLVPKGSCSLCFDLVPNERVEG